MIKNPIFEILQEMVHTTHLLKLLDKMYKHDKYEMDPTRTVGTTEWTQDVRRMDGHSETNIPPNNFVVRGYKKKTVGNIAL